MKNQVKMALLSQAENVGVARMTAAVFSAQAAFTLSEIDEIKVAVSEAVSNAIIHGYAKGQGMVDFTMTLYEDRIEYQIEDAGVGIADIAAAREFSYSTDPERTGLGFAFMESFMDRLSVESVPGRGTIVKMVKNFSFGRKEQVV